MAYDGRSIANFFLRLAWEERLPVSHLAIQKILFFAHAWHLGRSGEPLIGQSFEAWKYGPVLRVVYDQLKRFKDMPVTSPLLKIDIETGNWIEATVDLSGEDCEFLGGIFNYYSKFHAGQLVDLTHVADGPWAKIWNKAVENAVPGMVIPDEEIKLWILREGRREGSSTH